MNAEKNWQANSGAKRLYNISRADPTPPDFIHRVPERLLRPDEESAALRPPSYVSALPLIKGEHFPRRIPRVIAARAKQAAMPMTIVNNVIDMARLLFHQAQDHLRWEVV